MSILTHIQVGEFNWRVEQEAGNTVWAAWLPDAAHPDTGAPTFTDFDLGALVEKLNAFNKGAQHGTSQTEK
jgi:hypothetical protein